MDSKAFNIDRDYVAEVGRRSEAESARSLELLDAIEVTCGVLHAQADWMEREFQAVHDLVARINARPLPQMDANGSTVALLRKGQEHVAKIIESMALKRGFAERDPRLREGDGVIEAYDRAIEVAREYHNALDELIFAILESDADVSQQSATYSSADELLTALKR